MLKINKRTLRLAMARFAAGEWVYQAETGVVLSGMRGVRMGRELGRRNSFGYVMLTLRDGQKCYSVLAHRVIWIHVNGPISSGMTINHKNSVRHDNRIENLELMTLTENFNHACEYGSVVRVLSDDDVRLIRSSPRNRQEHIKLAARFGVTDTHIWNVQNRRRRSRVEDIKESA